ncbi:NAD(P)-dependent oxidoreductase [Aureimonas mangrovi]|uniref:NAD(P)-dependent oxidoreductase n=1 Tax=Aureimonas mangrovi TaxID=2758041 RepID=UPI00163DB63F|nr:NAD(P)-dependent oxidoreductase [Aureimonas mangrovi]
MAKIALIGASGNVGRRILQELSGRGHQVTAIARNVDKIPELPGVTKAAGDLDDREGIVALLRGHDVAVSAVRFADISASRLVSIVKEAGVGRYLVVGGAGSLEVAPGKRLVDQPDFPAAYHAEASAGTAFLDHLKTVDDLDWTFLSPAALFVPGERTGQFRLGGDELMADANGNSQISYEDYAIAIADEIERPAHSRKRFSVAY